MNEILKVNYEAETPTVSARDLHEALEINTKFQDWIPRMLEYGFEESKDYNLLKNEKVQIEGCREVKREVIDYNVTVSMAKEICMIQRTEKGKQCRTYFIELEKAWNTPEQIFARALKMADKVIQQKDKLIIEMKPKAEFFDAVASSKTALPMDKVAKVLDIGIGRNKLFQILRDKKILDKDNAPYQTYVDRGYFRVVEQKYVKPNGETQINIKTLVYQKGVEYIRKVVA